MRRPPMNIKGVGKVAEVWEPEVPGANKRKAPEMPKNLVQIGGYRRASVGMPASELSNSNQRLRFSHQQQQRLQSFGARVNWMASGVEHMREAHEVCAELSIDIKQLKKWISNHRPRELRGSTIPNQVVQPPWVVGNHLPYPMYVGGHMEACPKGQDATARPAQNIYPSIPHPLVFGYPAPLLGTGILPHHDQRAQAMSHSPSSGCQVPALGVPFLELNHFPAEDNVWSAGKEGCSLDGADIAWQEGVELRARETQDTSKSVHLGNADNLRQVLKGKMKDLSPDKVQKLVDLCKIYRQKQRCAAHEVPFNTPPWTKQLVSSPEEKGQLLSTSWLSSDDATPQHEDNNHEGGLLELSTPPTGRVEGLAAGFLSGGDLISAEYEDAFTLCVQDEHGSSELSLGFGDPLLEGEMAHGFYESSLAGQRYDEASLLYFPAALNPSCFQRGESDVALYTRAETSAGVQLGPLGGTPCLSVTRGMPMERRRDKTLHVKGGHALSSPTKKPKVERATNATMHWGQEPVTSQPMRGKFLFEKVLTASDTGPLGRIVLPKSQAELHLPKLLDKEGRLIRVEDAYGRWWQLRYRFWPNNRTQIYILEHTAPFVRSHGLVLGDSLCVCRADEGHLVIPVLKILLEVLKICCRLMILLNVLRECVATGF